ncbi:MAG: tRNA glutamyl-Q(34) synthetase GluQRS [Alphaproteobacteria bacterium]
MIITRFAPSPTGRLHLGSVYAALYAHDAAREADGRFLLRIEDIDQGRARPEFEAGILEDLKWLGLDWDGPVLRQSERGNVHQAALQSLKAQNLVYPCFCTRREIAEEIANAGAAPHGPEGPVYPGTCRVLSDGSVRDRLEAGDAYALRLNVGKAAKLSGSFEWHDRQRGFVHAQPTRFGDIVLARKDAPAAYHLAVVVDDAASNVTLVTRGEDLFEATDVQVLLQRLLGLPTPAYAHHGLALGADGKRLAKRDRAATIAALRAEGHTPDAVRVLARQSVSSSESQ